MSITLAPHSIFNNGNNHPTSSLQSQRQGLKFDKTAQSKLDNLINKTLSHLNSDEQKEANAVIQTLLQEITNHGDTFHAGITAGSSITLYDKKGFDIGSYDLYRPDEFFKSDIKVHPKVSTIVTELDRLNQNLPKLAERHGGFATPEEKGLKDPTNITEKNETATQEVKQGFPWLYTGLALVAGTTLAFFLGKTLAAPPQPIPSVNNKNDLK
jgi:hypothetical protein